MTKRIGLYGGGFDPPHVAHLALARQALDELRLDELRWLPTGHPYHKDRQASPAEDRAAMVALAIEGEPRFRLDRTDLERAGPTYTLDTVKLLQGDAAPAPGGDHWYLLIGQDQYARFDTWHGWRELLQRVTLAVAGRAGDEVAPPPALLAVPHDMVALHLPAMAVSASDVRARVSAGEPIDGLVPAPVARYIARRRLYAGVPRS